jgi:MFS family permease
MPKPASEVHFSSFVILSSFGNSSFVLGENEPSISVFEIGIMPEPHDPYAALRQPDYRRLLAGGLLASLGAEMQAVAIGWEIYQRTNTPWLLGLVGLVQFLPVLCLALPAGHVADRANRKRLLLCALAVMASASSGLALVSFFELPLALVYGLLMVAGAARAFSIPARWAILPQVVPADVLHNAVTWNSSGWQLATISGPALGGVVIATLQPAGAYCATAICLVTAMFMITSIRSNTDAPRHRPVEEGSVELPISQAWWAGAHFIWISKPILAAMTLDLFAVLLGGATALLPIFAKDILDVHAVGLGFLRTAPSVGALIMAVSLAHAPPLARPGIALLIAVAGFGIATIVFGFSENYALSWAALALTGGFDNVSVVVRGTLIQTMTPDALRGRVAAVNAVFISSSNELGALESGVAAQFLGPVWAVVLGGAGTLLVVLSSIGIWPDLMRLTTPRSAALDALAPSPEEGMVEEEMGDQSAPARAPEGPVH